MVIAMYFVKKCGGPCRYSRAELSSHVATRVATRVLSGESCRYSRAEWRKNLCFDQKHLKEFIFICGTSC